MDWGRRNWRVMVAGEGEKEKEEEKGRIVAGERTREEKY